MRFNIAKCTVSTLACFSSSQEYFRTLIPKSFLSGLELQKVVAHVVVAFLLLLLLYFLFTLSCFHKEDRTDNQTCLLMHELIRHKSSPAGPPSHLHMQEHNCNIMQQLLRQQLLATTQLTSKFFVLLCIS